MTSLLVTEVFKRQRPAVTQDVSDCEVLDWDTQTTDPRCTPFTLCNLNSAHAHGSDCSNADPEGKRCSPSK